MERRNFIKSAALTSLAASTATLANCHTTTAVPQDQLADQQEIYELRVYSLRFLGPGNLFNAYLADALIPALNRQGIKNIGAFKEMGGPTPTKVYILVPYPSMQHFLEMPGKLSSDTTYQAAAEAYHNLPVEKQIYTRYESWLMEAFSGIPKMRVPKQEDRIFELRTYEAFSDDAVGRKVKMFNKEELVLFDEVGLHSVFFGKILIGPQMPALTYMLTFKDMEERDKNWKAFLDHPEWNRMKALPEYANTVSNIIRVFLKSMPMSQV